MPDVDCPICMERIAFQNLLIYEPEEVEVVEITYKFKCMKCETVFGTEPRFSGKATKSQLKKIKGITNKAMKDMKRKAKQKK